MSPSTEVATAIAAKLAPLPAPPFGYRKLLEQQAKRRRPRPYDYERDGL
jgi:hypothetical protein